MWRPGDRLTHRHNPDLGPGRVVAVQGRTLVVEFPETETTLRLSAGSDALVPLAFAPGTRAVREDTGRKVTVEAALGQDTYRLEDGSVVAARELWPLEAPSSLIERLARGQVDPIEDVANRVDALHLAALRESSGLGSFLGGRIHLFPHQLYVAERASRSDPVRWLLADEVGLGKTVEACLILNHLVRTGRAERALVVAPATLVVQWLGELWRKYHQVFVLLDEKRIADVAREFGAGFNPFDAHRRAVLSFETLLAEPSLPRRAVEAGLDLLIVDEAHRLKRPPGHPGEPAYRAVAPLAGAARHALLLTATPLEEDAHGFFRLLQLLRPDAFPDEGSLEERLERGEPLPPCTSATRRLDIGGLPPRVPSPAIVEDDEGWAALERLVEAIRKTPAPHAVARRMKADRVVRALSSGAAALAVLDKQDPDDVELRRLARAAQQADPRVRWLVRQARGWKEAGEKTLVFVAHRESLEALQAAMSSLGQLRAGVFHEDMSPAQRDIEVAQFRLSSGPSLLVSTEAGGEGRNFEFCHRLVLFDLPWSPTVVEQRIGRLDRIGRAIPVEIVYFKPPRGLAAAVAHLYELLGLFREPLSGIERELGRVEDALTEAVLDMSDEVRVDTLEAAVSAARAGRSSGQRAADQALHRDPYHPEMAPSILARVPEELDELTEEVVRTACERLGLHVEEQRGRSVWLIELGNRSLVESLPGVSGGARFLGTFDREEAVQNETLDFFASGHPLVEGILADLEDGARGRVGLLHVDLPEDAEQAEASGGMGLLALYKDGPRFRAVALDARGREQPEWAERLSRRPLRSRRVQAETWTRRPSWAKTILSLGQALSRLEPHEPPVLVAALVTGR